MNLDKKYMFDPQAALKILIIKGNYRDAYQLAACHKSIMKPAILLLAQQLTSATTSVNLKAEVVNILSHACFDDEESRESNRIILLDYLLSSKQPLNLIPRFKSLLIETCPVEFAERLTSDGQFSDAIRVLKRALDLNKEKTYQSIGAE